MLAASRCALPWVCREHQATFLADGQLSLINRLRHNVIKAGLRKINVAYARISIADICEKLKLEDKQDAEYIVAKAIRDGVIDATLDHGAQELRSNENQDIYATTEPQELYHKRIQFCLNIHNEAVQAMSYPDDSVSGKDDKESVRSSRRLAAGRLCLPTCPNIGRLFSATDTHCRANDAAGGGSAGEVEGGGRACQVDCGGGG